MTFVGPLTKLFLIGKNHVLPLCRCCSCFPFCRLLPLCFPSLVILDFTEISLRCWIWTAESPVDRGYIIRIASTHQGIQYCRCIYVLSPSLVPPTTPSVHPSRETEDAGDIWFRLVSIDVSAPILYLVPLALPVFCWISSDAVQLLFSMQNR